MWDSPTGEGHLARCRWLVCGLVVLSGATERAVAQGQVTGAQGSRYESSFFQTFSPNNALELIQVIPGFILVQGDNELRGFRQSAGNVVINGRRPSTKRETLGTFLSRIPASRVVRVELTSGDKFGADYAGRALVANLVLSDVGGLAATVEGTVRREYTGALLPEGSASALLRRGPSTFSMSLGISNRESSEEGFDRVTDLPSGAETEFRQKTTRFRNPEPSASLGWSLDEGEHRSANVNASLALDYENLTQASLVRFPGGLEREDSLTQRWATRTVEVGADVTRPLWGGGIKLLGLTSRRYRNLQDRTSEYSVAGAWLGGNAQSQRDWREETVGRVVWSGSTGSGWALEAGVESALNRLDGRVDLLALNTDGQATKLDLPADRAVVTEGRSEAFVNAGRPLTSRLRLDLGMAYERSHLKVAGDVTAERSLDFLKPKATLDWRAGTLHLQFTAERSVSQLNFEDFVTAAELSTDRVSSGNPDIEPERSWQFLLSVDRTLLGDGRIKLDLGYDFISNVEDRVPTPQGFDAPGNLGKGSLFSAASNVDLPLAKMGINGGRLTLYGSYVDSSVRDPYTLRHRPFSSYASFNYEARFRQDLAKFAWGVSVSGSTGSDTFRRTEVDFNRGISPNASAFVEFRPSDRWTFTFGASNLLDRTRIRERDFYTPDRTSAAPDGREERYRNSHTVGYITIKSSIF
jgi:outer membrane receptor protein involved in Fe transport